MMTLGLNPKSTGNFWQVDDGLGPTYLEGKHCILGSCGGRLLPLPPMEATAGSSRRLPEQLDPLEGSKQDVFRKGLCTGSWWKTRHALDVESGDVSLERPLVKNQQQYKEQIFSLSGSVSSLCG